MRATTAAQPPVTESRQVERNRDYYEVRSWGAGFFDIDGEGFLTVRPEGRGDSTSRLSAIVEDAMSKGARTPMLIRFPQVLDARVTGLNQAFARAISNYDYTGRYRGVYPIKVNPDPEVLARVARTGQRFGYGMEVGSKAELAVALAQPLAEGAYLICNGYKDKAYIELALAAAAAGRPVVLIAEKPREVREIVRAAEADQTNAMLGIRLKLSSKGAGRWEKSSGPLAKFGLNIQELLEAVQWLEERGRTSALKLLHFHIGSQITEIRRVREAVREGARAYAKLVQRGIKLSCVDVGGGLGVDYDGSKTNFDSSMNYELQEYANTVVYTIQEVCKTEGVAEPDIVSESGRAVAAYHSVLVTEVLEQVGALSPEPPPPVPDEHGLVHELSEIHEGLNTRNYREAYHDAIDHIGELQTLFSLGYVSMEERARGEWFFRAICERCITNASRGSSVHEDFQELRDRLARKYVCNFSIFQSLPDSWTVDQLFPVVPLSRLDEPATVPCTLGDITCDSDGKIDRFIDKRDIKESLNLHELNDGERYYLGCFLVGAYQDVLGDFHNLFGMVDEIVVLIDEDGEHHVKRVNLGDTTADVVRRFGYRSAALQASFDSWVERGREAEKLTERDVEQICDVYARALEDYTYLRAPPPGGDGEEP